MNCIIEWFSIFIMDTDFEKYALHSFGLNEWEIAMEDKLAMDAMQIILNAGDARTLTMSALKALESFDVEKANGLIKEAQLKIVEAHKVQTNAIQSEARGESFEYSVLFAHAQDTLMVINSEMNISKKLIGMFSSIDERLANIEKQLSK